MIQKGGPARALWTVLRDATPPASLLRMRGLAVNDRPDRPIVSATPELQSRATSAARAQNEMARNRRRLVGLDEVEKQRKRKYSVSQSETIGFAPWS
jgi:hypothetical protein